MKNLIKNEQLKHETLNAARDSFIEELEEILAGHLIETNLFLVHGDGGTEEDEEGGSQKGETQE